MRPLGASGPREVGKYRMLAELGRGGMGRVLLGSGPDGRLVALKLVHEQFAEDDGFRARFHIEVNASRAVSGAYTAPVVDADPDAATPWLASAFVPGPSLHDAIATVGALPEPSVLRLAAGLATALIQIHRAELVHRDLKPSNVLLADDGPRVIDFGIVRAVNGQAGALTRVGWLVGSPEFMSPEQAKAEPVTPASDVFSLGSVVVAACTGASPFTDTATQLILNKVVHVDLDLSGVPAAIRRIAEPCLAKDPADRPTAAELLGLIGQIAPSARPWPPAVHQLIALRHAEIAQLLEPDEPTVITDDGAPTAVSTVVNSSRPAEPTIDSGDATPTRRATAIADRSMSWRARRRWLRLGAVMTALALVGVLVWALWPAPQISQVGVITGSSPAETVVFSPDGATLAIIYKDNTVAVRKVASRQQVTEILGPLGNNSASGLDVVDVAFSQDGRTLTTASTDDNHGSIVQRWNATSGQQIGQPLTFNLIQNRRQALSLDGRTVAGSVMTPFDAASDEVVQVWDVAGRQQNAQFTDTELEQYRSNPVFSPDGRTVAARDASSDALSLWDVRSQRRVGDPVTADKVGGFDAFAFSPDGRILVTARSSDGTGTVQLRDVSSHYETRQPLAIPATGEFFQVALSADGRTLATIDVVGGVQRALRLWNVDTGEQVGATIDNVTIMAFGPDGRTLAAVEENRTVLWSIPSS